MTEAQIKLLLLVTDRVFSLLDKARQIKEMSEEKVLEEIERERTIKDSLVEEVIDNG